MSQTFQFDGYNVRPAAESDRSYLESRIEADAYHSEKVDADFFLQPLPGETSWALEDSQGKVVFYFKTTPAVRMAIQFAGDSTPIERERNRNALTRGLAWLEVILAASRFREIIFDVDSPELSLFSRKRLGFAYAPKLLVRALPTFDTPNVRPESVGSLPTNIAGRGQ